MDNAMDAVSELLLNGIVRTTLCTTLAALATLLILPILGINSSRTHRVAWVLVILQGWLILPLTFTVSVADQVPAEQSSIVSSIPAEPSQTILPQIQPRVDEPLMWQRHGKQAVFVLWLLGTMVVLGLYLKRYFSLIAHTPLGSVPESTVWKKEWCEAADTISTRKNVHFRVTHSVGPLLCFVPFIYLVLVPKVLWTRLSREDRLAILRHELAHLKHGDLWKNLLIRIFALPQWFNPLVWLAVRRFEEAGEWSCDEAVIASSNLASTGYASTLLRVADFSANTPCGAVAASGGLLTRRITRLLSSSNKEVSQVKNLALPLLLSLIAIGQIIRIESVHAEEPVEAAIAATRAEALAKWHSEPYRIEPPDVLSIKIRWEANDTVELIEKEVQVIGNTQIDSRNIGLPTSIPSPRPIALGFVNSEVRCIVSPDGKITRFGKLFVAGMTTDEVQKAIIDKLPKHAGIPTVIVDVAESYSKVVYVIKKQASGDNVARIPHTGHLTVLEALASTETNIDAIDHAYVLSPYGPNNTDDRLEVDLDALNSDRNNAANFELLPGDRLFLISDAGVLQYPPARPVAIEPTGKAPPTTGQYYIESPVNALPVTEQYVVAPTRKKKPIAVSVGDTVMLELTGTPAVSILRLRDAKGYAAVKDGNVRFSMPLEATVREVKESGEVLAHHTAPNIAVGEPRIVTVAVRFDKSRLEHPSKYGPPAPSEAASPLEKQILKTMNKQAKLPLVRIDNMEGVRLQVWKTADDVED